MESLKFIISQDARGCRLHLLLLLLCALMVYTCEGVGYRLYGCPAVCECEMARHGSPDIKVDCTGKNLSSIPDELGYSVTGL